MCVCDYVTDTIVSNIAHCHITPHLWIDALHIWGHHNLSREYKKKVRFHVCIEKREEKSEK